MKKKLVAAINKMEKVIMEGKEGTIGMVAALKKNARKITEVEEKAIEKSLYLACRL
jgi:hypothetical protein